MSTGTSMSTRSTDETLRQQATGRDPSAGVLE